MDNKNQAKIKNLKLYNLRMTKAMYDKLFFIDKVIGVNAFIDYGCADGTLLRHVNHFEPDAILYGYDYFKSELKFAAENLLKAKCITKEQIYRYFDYNFNNMQHHVADNKNIQKSCLILSSVIHEVYSYQNLDKVNEFWSDHVFPSYEGAPNFDYIAIRDMIPSRNIDRSSDLNDVRKIYSKFDKKLIEHFESIWGSIDNNKNLIHFLLKYQYTDNWAREVHENYLPITRSDLLSRIPDNYDIVYQEHFVLPYLYNQVKKDFDIEIKDNTHLKIILKKK